MSKVTVGKDVLSYCNKCKLNLSHIIVAMKNAKTIHRVECNTCKSTHAYKDPSAAKTVKRKTGKKKRTASVPVAEVWMEAINKSKSKSVDYSLKGSYAVGDIINHSKFGPGVVDEIVDNDKISVIFRHEIKTLIHNRP